MSQVKGQILCEHQIQINITDIMIKYNFIGSHLSPNITLFPQPIKKAQQQKHTGHSWQIQTIKFKKSFQELRNLLTEEMNNKHWLIKTGRFLSNVNGVFWEIAGIYAHTYRHMLLFLIENVCVLKIVT